MTEIRPQTWLGGKWDGKEKTKEGSYQAAIREGAEKEDRSL